MKIPESVKQFQFELDFKIVYNKKGMGIVEVVT